MLRIRFSLSVNEKFWKMENAMLFMFFSIHFSLLFRMYERNMTPDGNTVLFGQLMGMRDHISFSLGRVEVDIQNHLNLIILSLSSNQIFQLSSIFTQLPKLLNSNFYYSIRWFQSSFSSWTSFCQIHKCIKIIVIIVAYQFHWLKVFFNFVQLMWTKVTYLTEWGSGLDYVM